MEQLKSCHIKLIFLWQSQDRIQVYIKMAHSAPMRKKSWSCHEIKIMNKTDVPQDVTLPEQSMDHFRD